MDQKPILTITLNPALDRATRVDSVVAGPKLRCDAPQSDPGGGGINVSRAIRILGGASRAFAVLGGPTGAAMSDLLARDGIDCVIHPAPGDTRDSFTVTDGETGAQYRFVLPGPIWAPGDVVSVIQAISGASVPGGIVVVSGSQPPGVPDDFVAGLGRRLAGSGVSLIVDTSGAPLASLGASGGNGLAVLRLNHGEAEHLAGGSLPDRAAIADFASDLVARDVARTVILATGADGSILVNADERLFCNSPQTQVVSKVGAGDSFVGAFTLALAQGEEPADCLRWGCAGAAAAVMTPATDLCRRRDVEGLLAQTAVTAL